MPIDRGLTAHVDIESGLTTFQAVGAVTSDELGRAVMAFNEGEPTELVLWDFTRADLSGIRPEHVRHLVALASAGDPARPTGRTAFVFASQGGYGLGRMFEIMQELKDSPVVRQSFIDMAEARQWLGLV